MRQRGGAPNSPPPLSQAIKVVKRSNPKDKIKLLRRNYQQSETTFGSDRQFLLNSTENSIRKEIAIMKKCRHPNIVRTLEVIDDPRQDKIYMGMHAPFERTTLTLGC